MTCWVLLILVLMVAFGQTEMSFIDLFTTENGLWLWFFVLVFSLVQPLYGYCKKVINADAASIEDAIDDMARRGGYDRIESVDGCTRYRAKSFFKRLILQFEDEIVVRTQDGESTIEGPRKEVVKLYCRIDTYLISNK